MLATRLKFALPLSAITIAAFFVPGVPGQIAFMVFATLMLVGGVREIFELSAGDKRPGLLEYITYFYSLFLLSAVLGYSGGYFKICGLSMPQVESVALICWLILGALACFRKDPDQANVHLLMTGVFAVLVVNMLLLMPKIYFMAGGEGRFALFFMVLVTKLSDVGAYALGTATAKLPNGNHKLAKKISPKKSWEGLLGGIIFGTAAAVITYYCAGDHLVFDGANPLLNSRFELWEVIALGICLPVMGLIGDLMESLLKRAADAKDSGHIPGMGGVLDILDSLIIATPFFYMWIVFHG